MYQRSTGGTPVPHGMPSLFVGCVTRHACYQHRAQISPPRNTPEPKPLPVTNPTGLYQHMHGRDAKPLRRVCDAACLLPAPLANLPAAEHTRTKAPTRHQPLVCSRGRFPCVTLQRRHHVPLPVRALRHLAPAHTPYGSLQHMHGWDAKPLRRVCDAACLLPAPLANLPAAEHTRIKAPRRYQPPEWSRRLTDIRNHLE